MSTPLDEVVVVARANNSDLAFGIFTMGMLLIPVGFFALLFFSGPDFDSCDVVDPDFLDCRMPLPLHLRGIGEATTYVDHQQRQVLTRDRLANDLGLGGAEVRALVREAPGYVVPMPGGDARAYLERQSDLRLMPMYSWRPYDLDELRQVAASGTPALRAAAQKLIDNDPRLVEERAERLSEELRLRRQVLEPLWRDRGTRATSTFVATGVVGVVLVLGIAGSLVLRRRRQPVTVHVTRNQLRFGDETVAMEDVAAEQPSLQVGALRVHLETGASLALPSTHRVTQAEQEELVAAVLSAIRTASGPERPEDQHALGALLHGAKEPPA